MNDNRCPNCENDISQTVTATVIAMLEQGESSPRTIACPHCGEELSVSARVSTLLSRQMSVQ
jgi:uncharacterized protein with PIN domain